MGKIKPDKIVGPRVVELDLLAEEEILSNDKMTANGKWSLSKMNERREIINR